MSQQANIVAYDGAATPAVHTLVPIKNWSEKGKTFALWREQVSTLPVYAQVSCLTKSERIPSGVHKVSLRVEVPVMESVSGQNAAGYTAAPKVAYVLTMEVTAFLHERSTIAEHKLVRQLATNILGSIATSVAPVTTGVSPELFDQLVTAG